MQHLWLQEQSKYIIKKYRIIILIEKKSPVNIVGSLLQDTYQDTSDEEEEEEEEDERETISGQPRYPAYLSDLLGPDLPEDDDEDYEDLDDDEEPGDNYGSLAFRDPTDNEFLGGFELSHFKLVPSIPGYDEVDLRKEEQDVNETSLK